MNHESERERLIRRVREAKDRHAPNLMKYANVTGVGVGLREVGRRLTDEVCLRVYVRRKLPEAELPPGEVLPRRVDQVTVDVVEGEFSLMQHASPPLPLAQRVARHFPLMRPGVSVGGLRVTAGTLGTAAYDRFSGQQLLLSNWHVLCGAPDCVPGEEIVQPGVFDGGAAPRDTAARLLRFANTDRVDAAVAVVSEHRYLFEAIPGIGLVRGTARAVLGSRVRKSGRTTGVTSGIVDDVSADINLSDGSFFRDQIVVVRDNGGVIVAGGDSGSAVLDEQNMVVGLLFAGRTDGSRWMANHIEEVILALGIRFTPEPTPLQIAASLLAAVP